MSAQQQFGSPLSREQWKDCIGAFVVAMGEIEGMTHAIRRQLCGGECSNSWISKPLKGRLEDLVQQLVGSELEKELGAELFQVKRMLWIRNLLAHGTFALDGTAGTGTGTPYLVFWKYAKTNDPDPSVLNQMEMMISTKILQERSDNISRLIAEVGFERRRVASAPPQGT
ncbi:hypothetical protein PSEUDO8Z_10448 [Pseudomonas sp. 8Z]|uniref:hypothetical protein n=1 Tax=Pseudomonas sp. 8Z TaxID=2653166 RepID=UPI0012EFB513|nr:hypothetical protein [Pseudomonas sp. 8Z]VXC22354.1 hypothetical protein PSEUDO8Z_10448 [Pseudomonas sp. 8Z]